MDSVERVEHLAWLATKIEDAIDDAYAHLEDFDFEGRGYTDASFDAEDSLRRLVDECGVLRRTIFEMKQDALRTTAGRRQARRNYRGGR